MSIELVHNFLVIEGNIGAGKTTLATQIAERSNSRLLPEQFADNPFLPKFYADPEKHAFPLELSFLAERYHQLKTEFAKQDLFKPNIVSDYYFLKCLIFAKNNLKDDEYDLYSKLFHIINDSLPKPDLFVYLYHSIDQLQVNIKKRGRSYEQAISNEYLESIQSMYFDFMKQLRQIPILIIDVTGIDYSENQAHLNQLISSINRRYEKGITRIKVNF